MSQMQPASLIREMAGFARHIVHVSRHRSLFALIFLFLGSATEGLSILMMLPILGMVATNGSREAIAIPEQLMPYWPFGTQQIELWVLLAAFVLLITAQALFNRFKTIYMSQLVYAFTNRVRIEMLEAIARANWSAFMRERPSDLNHTLNGEIARIQTAAIYCFTMIQTTVLLVAYLVVSLVVSSAMTAVAALAGLAMLLILRPIRRRSARFGKELTASGQIQFQTVSEFLAGFKIAKSLNVESLFLGRFQDTLARNMDDNRRYVGVSTIGTAAFQITSATAGAVFIYVALVVLNLTIAQILVMLLVFMRVAPRFMELQSQLQQVGLNLPAFTAMTALKARFDLAAESFPAAATRAITLERELRVSSLSLVHAGNGGTPAVSDVSFTIPAKRVTALIGHSGSGKSTIADMLLGLVEPTGGVFTVDGVRIERDNRRQWRSRVAYVPQDVFLLNDTIAANLRLAAPDASDSALWSALDAAQAATFVERLDKGMDTPVGDRGARLSGGERQRIALARALLRKPELLILDEATSALDWQSQALVTQAVRALRGSMTILTIAHRPSMITFADWVVALEDGKVIESGSFKKLSGKPTSRIAQLLAAERHQANGKSSGNGAKMHR